MLRPLPTLVLPRQHLLSFVLPKSFARMCLHCDGADRLQTTRTPSTHEPPQPSCYCIQPSSDFFLQVLPFLPGDHVHQHIRSAWRQEQPQQPHLSRKTRSTAVVQGAAVLPCLQARDAAAVALVGDERSRKTYSSRAKTQTYSRRATPYYFLVCRQFYAEGHPDLPGLHMVTHYL